MLGEYGFRVELHAFHRELAVAHAHDLAVVAPGADLERGWQRRSLDRERMVARRREGVRQPAEYPAPVVADGGGLAVHELLRVHDPAAERLPDRLVPEADAQDRE